MQLFRNLDQIPERFRGGALSIGNFDGVHRGHARIVQRLLAMAESAGGPAIVFTFDPHPASLLRPDQAPAPLCWTQRKAELLGDLGVDAMVAYPTDEVFLRLEAREFFEQIVRKKLAAKAMVEGSNFLFGHNRTGTTKVLRQLCEEADVSLEVVEAVRSGDTVVSSSRVREVIAGGHVDQAWTMLARPYRIRGQVAHGAGRGVQLGFPTANLERVDTLLPAEGIYAGRAWVEGNVWPAAMNIGPNPTFDEQQFKVEAYLIGFDADIYDQTIEIDFLERLRDIERFESVDQLTAKMNLDVAATRRIVERHDLKSEI